MLVKHLEIVSEENSYVVKNLVNNSYVRMGSREISYLMQLIGGDESELDLSNPEELSKENKELLFSKFEKWGLLESELNKRTNGMSKKHGISKIPLLSFQPDKFLRRLYPIIKIFISKIGIVLGLFIIISSFVCMFIYGDNVVESLNTAIHSNWMIIPYLYLAMIITLFFHELGHAGACIYSGGKVNKIGLMLFYFTPALYCDVSDVYMLGSSKAKFKVSIAGIYVNALFGSISLLIVCLGNLTGALATFFILYYIANVGFVFFNLIPFIKLDGYWILVSLLKINNLMNKSVLLFCSIIFDHKLFRMLSISNSKRILLSIYGLGCIVAKPFFWTLSVCELYLYLSSVLNQVITLGILFVMISIIVYDLVFTIIYYRNLFMNDRKRFLCKI